MHLQALLAAPHTCARLHRLLRLVSRLGELRCATCQSAWASACDGVALSPEGAGGAFVNAHGYVHDMLTVRAVRGLGVQGRPTTQDSWFPGYAWTIAHCARCYAHAGWRFTPAPAAAAAATEAAAAAPTFWGLRRGAFKHHFSAGGGGSSGDDDDDDG
jgi:cereblon